MIVITADMMRDIDKAAIDDHGIPGLDLMESAGAGVAHKILDLLGDTRGHNVSIFCGKGNNGGDGLVAARYLADEGIIVKVFLLANPDEMTGDPLHNLQRLPDKVTLITIKPGDDLSDIADQMSKENIIADAILGTGIQGSVKPEYARIIELINNSGAHIVAVDIASGVEGSTGKIGGIAVRADHTCALAIPKLGHFLQPGCEYTGQLDIIDIGITPVVLDKFDFKFEILDTHTAKDILPPRQQISHKGNFGKVLVIGGSTGMGGAVSLTSQAVLKSGAGMVLAATPSGIQDKLAINLTESMTTPLTQNKSGTLCPDSLNDLLPALKWADVIAIGPGMGVNDDVIAFMEKFLELSDHPLIIDADGIKAVAPFKMKLGERNAFVAISPHPGELAEFLEINIKDIQSDYFNIALETAEQFNITILLKTHRSVAASPDGRATINTTGNSGMATAGSGDVLTGIITGLLAQGTDIYNAVRLGTFIHGLAGDIAAKDLTEYSLIATDIIKYLPNTFSLILTGE